jgi:hypothetical protein
MAHTIHATLCSKRAGHNGHPGKQALEQSSKYRVNENGEESSKDDDVRLDKLDRFVSFALLGMTDGESLQSSLRAKAKQSRR